MTHGRTLLYGLTLATFATSIAAAPTQAQASSSQPSPSAPALVETTPPPAPKRTKLLVLDLKPNDVPEATVKTVQGVVITNLAKYPELDVISGDDVKQLVQLEADKSAMGCSDDAGCLAEIADALGAELVVFGTLGHLGDDVIVNLNLFDAKLATGLGRVVVQTDSVKTLPKKLRPKLHELLSRFYKERGIAMPELPPEIEDDAVAATPTPWILAGTGAAAVVAGAAVALIGALPLLQYDEAKRRVLAAEAGFADDPSTLDAARAAQADLAQSRAAWNSFGYLAVDGGVALAAVGAVVAVTGLIWGAATSGPAPTEGGTP